MAKDDPFADLDEVDHSPSKKDQKKAERDSRKRAKMELTDTLDDLDLEKKPANPYVLLVSLALLLGAFAFSLKPVSISLSGKGVYAVVVEVVLIGKSLAQNECRPSGKFQNLEMASIKLTSAAMNYSQQTLDEMNLDELQELANKSGIQIQNEEKEQLIALILKKQAEDSRGVSDFSASQSFPFADASNLETACLFEIPFNGVLPTDGTSFEVAIQLPDRVYQVVHKLDPQMKIGPIEFNLN